MLTFVLVFCSVFLPVFSIVTDAECSALTGVWKQVVDGACYVLDDISSPQINRAVAKVGCTQLTGGHLAVLDRPTLDQLYQGISANIALYSGIENYNFHTALERVDTSSQNLSLGWAWVMPDGSTNTFVDPAIWGPNEPNNHTVESPCNDYPLHVAFLWTNINALYLLDGCAELNQVVWKICQYGEPPCGTQPCNTRDSGAQCASASPGFTCTCSAGYSGTLCDIPVGAWKMVEEVEKSVNLSKYKENAIQISTAISDAVPFLIGGLDYPLQKNLSWTYEDLLSHCTFAGKACDLPNDIVLWFEPNMGNCFTFNHKVIYKHYNYMLKRAGLKYGLSLFLKTSQEEYVPWIPTAGDRVFIHNQNVSIFSESIGHGVPPGQVTTLSLRYSIVKKRGQPYSNCINDKKELKYYYYKDEYAVEACYRTCYQNEVFKKCGCMDPRYPSDPVKPLCQVQNRNCLNDFLIYSGNPDSWDCSELNNCPLPCMLDQYHITITRTPFVDVPAFCRHLTGDPFTECISHLTKNVMKLQVFFEEMDYRVYEEMPKYPLSKFLAHLGGQIGILCGMSVISLTEIIFMGFKILFTSLTGEVLFGNDYGYFNLFG